MAIRAAVWQFDWYVDSDDLQPTSNALFLLPALSLPSALIAHACRRARRHVIPCTVGRRCQARPCCVPALRCSLRGRCMSHDRCTLPGVRQVDARTQGGLTLPDATYFSSADRSAVLDEYGIRIQELFMLARMRAAAADSTAHEAIAVEASMARLSRSDARQSQQLPKR